MCSPLSTRRDRTRNETEVRVQVAKIHAYAWWEQDLDFASDK